jgi:hypothetical protein
VPRDSVIYARVHNDNHKWIVDKAAEADLSMSEYVDKLITALRNMNGIRLEVKTTTKLVSDKVSY